MGTRTETAMARLNVAMVKVFNDGDVEDAKETIRECLMASRTVRDGRDAQGHIIYKEVPDYPIRLTAGIKIIEWAIGKPTSTSIVANVGDGKAQNSPQTTDLLKLMFSMPAESAAILVQLQEAAARMKSGEVNVTPSVPQIDKSAS